MSSYLIDTTVVVDHLRGKTAATKFIDKFHPCISCVTEAELFEGATNKQEMAFIAAVCRNLNPLPLTADISQRSLELLRQFHLSHGLLFLDALIAVSSILNKFTFVTANLKHFSFIPAIEIVEWKKIEGEGL